MKRTPFLAAGGIALLVASPAVAGARKSITPYIELGQVLTADLQSGDVLTYSTASAGVDATISTRNVEVQLSYNYQHNFSWDKRYGDDDLHSGLARASVKVAPGVSIDGGALATRARSDIRGAAPAVPVGRQDNVTQLYSAYVGPTVATEVGPASLNASYRFGYTKVEAPGATGVAPGSPRLDNFDDSKTHLATASIGIGSGHGLPVGVTVSGQYERDDASQLKQRYEGKFGRGDVVVPVLPTLALTAGAGYEKIEVSQKDPALDGATGQPVVDANGRFVTNEASPRRIAYETDGLIYDAGLVWKPSPRTTLQARVGKRYGGMTYTGSLSYAASRSIGIQIAVYDSVDTFGRQLRDGIAALPSSFIDQRDAFSQQFSGCTFGQSNIAAGSCLNGVLQSISTASYRARGVDAVLSANRGPLSFGVGAGYANRKLYAPGGVGYTVYGVTDQSYYGQAYVSAHLDRNSGINGNLFVNYYESGLSNAPAVFSTGATASYYRNFGRVGTTLSAGLYNFSQDGFEDQTSGQAQVGVRYSF
ncbi:hypothetical protein ASG11_17285 [Sphingomonas sp. Leaf357]|uniref:hypothetical protein n=1 Tax=Sphingomonas sp. Leaf357 TaxID=1736350 RepID=UPI0006FD7A7E|nr:hypothetical protein [Sphingomonas sp. Leaf357]KQS01426.1 hypothetical protein ASG11_17285 [Sphingomonas sp. Leaf357]